MEARLMRSGVIGESSAWYRGTAVENRYRINNIPITAPRDMKATPEILTAPAAGDDEGADAISPADRAAQIGVKGCEKVLTNLIMGRGSDDNPKLRKVIVIDPWPQQLFWFEACWNLHSQWLNGCDIPCVVYMNTFKDGAGSHSQAAKSAMKGFLLREWWETHPDAGPVELRDISSTIEPPQLSLLAWDADNKPKMPDIVRNSFNDTASETMGPGVAATSWQKHCDQCMDQIRNMKGINRSAAPAVRGVKNKLSMTGPEFLETHPADLSKDLNLASKPIDGFDMSHVFLCRFYLIVHVKTIGNAQQLFNRAVYHVATSEPPRSHLPHHIMYPYVSCSNINV